MLPEATFTERYWPAIALGKVAQLFEIAAAELVAEEKINQKRGWKGRVDKYTKKVEANRRTLEGVHELLADAYTAGIVLPDAYTRE